ncbi:MAG: hypothetical protein L3K06_02955 [Thermoplasmata archaeon]|nr:hypothetical protein [Thermoplasmata archaeon]MCI4354305.1 hypothetical protein [Thermoplasmata archaeon]
MGSFVIWGASRSDLDRLAWSIAESIDPKFIWIEMTEGGAPPSSRELEVLEEIDLDRIDRMDRAELLDSASSDHRHPGTDHALTADLPHRLATRLHRPPPQLPPAALVLANLDRTVALARDGPAFLASLTHAARKRGLGLIATFGADVLPMPDSFDCLVRVTAGPAGNIWNPTVDWTVRSERPTPPITAPPVGSTSREVVRHIRSQRRDSG